MTLAPEYSEKDADYAAFCDYCVAAPTQTLEQVEVDTSGNVELGDEEEARRHPT